jgi:hypothetical protein
MLTEIGISKLPTPDKRKEIPAGGVAGLYLVVQPSGRRSWAFRYRAHGILPRKLTIGGFPAVGLSEARRRAREALGEVAGGKDPAGLKKASKAAAKAAKESDVDHVERVFEQFAKRYVASKVGSGWAKEVDRMFKVEILPVIGAKRIGEVRKAEILSLIDAIVDRGSPFTANRCLAILRKFFNWATDDRDLISVSPCKGIKPPAPEPAGNLLEPITREPIFLSPVVLPDVHRVTGALRFHRANL